jgi:type 1 glutamine amidotransferase
MLSRRRALRALAVLSLVFVLGPGVRSEEAAPKIKLLIITGSHGHDWKGTLPILKDFYTASRFDVDVTLDPKKELTPERLAKTDVILLHYKETRDSPGRWPAAAENALLEAVKGGKGLVVLHYASSAFDEGAASWPEYEKLIGGGWRRSKGHGAHAPLYQFRVEIKDPEHPVTKGLPPSFLHAKDELYHKLLIPEGSRVLAEALDDHPRGTGKKEPLVWVLQYGQGRVFHNALGHGADQMKGPGFQALMTRGAEWAATGKVTLEAPKSLDSPPEKENPKK